MNKTGMAILLFLLSASAYSDELDEPAGEKSLNTANVIRSAWELIRLSESLEPGVDTRCYIAKFAAFKAESLPASAGIVAEYESTDADAFAIQSAKQAMNVFEKNKVKEIAKMCESESDS